MKTVKPETLFVLLLQLHSKRELLTRYIYVWEREKKCLQDQKSRALKQLSYWLKQIGIRKAMLPLLQPQKANLSGGQR